MMLGKKVCFTIETYPEGPKFLSWVGSNEALMVEAIRTLVLEGEYFRFRITAHDGFEQVGFCEIRRIVGEETPRAVRVLRQLTKSKIEDAFWGSEIICVS